MDLFEVLIFMAIIYFGLGFHGLLRNLIMEIRKSPPPLCPHGVPDGEQGACPQCIKEAQEQLERHEREQQILSAARDLVRQEQKRIEQLRHRTLSNLLALDPFEFEQAVVQLYQTLGYTMNQTKRSGDGGVDAIGTKNGKQYIVQCKRYQVDTPVSRPQLQQFLGVLTERKADKGIFVTTGRFASTCNIYSKKYNIQLIDGDTLVSMIQKAYPEDETGAAQVKVMCTKCGRVTLLPVRKTPQRGVCQCGSKIENRITADNLDQQHVVGRDGFSISPGKTGEMEKKTATDGVLEKHQGEQETFWPEKPRAIGRSLSCARLGTPTKGLGGWQELIGDEKERFKPGVQNERIFTIKVRTRFSGSGRAVGTMFCEVLGGKVYRITGVYPISKIDTICAQLFIQYGRPKKRAPNKYEWQDDHTCLQVLRGQQVNVILTDKKLLMQA